MILLFRDYDKIENEYNKYKVKCKHCGHKILIPVWIKKRNCNWCGYDVYRDKKLEFKVQSLNVTLLVGVISIAILSPPLTVPN